MTTTDIINIVFTTIDVEDIADALGIDRKVAMTRANEWTSAIADTAIEMINEQLASVIEFNMP